MNHNLKSSVAAILAEKNKLHLTVERMKSEMEVKTKMALQALILEDYKMLGPLVAVTKEDEIVAKIRIEYLTAVSSSQKLTVKWMWPVEVRAVVQDKLEKMGFTVESQVDYHGPNCTWGCGCDDDSWAVYMKF
jgi:sulfur carrier protein ThiS